MSVRKRIAELVRRPAPPNLDIKRLKGRPNFRLRVGEYRVIFERKGRDVYIKDVTTRGSAYR